MQNATYSRRTSATLTGLWRSKRPSPNAPTPPLTLKNAKRSTPARRRAATLSRGSQRIYAALNKLLSALTKKKFQAVPVTPVRAKLKPVRVTLVKLRVSVKLKLVLVAPARYLLVKSCIPCKAQHNQEEQARPLLACGGVRDLHQMHRHLH